MSDGLVVSVISFSHRYHLVMEHLTPEQRLLIFETYNRQQCSILQTFRALRAHFGRNNRPTILTIRRVVQSVRTNLTFMDHHQLVRRRSVRNADNAAAVLASVDEDRELSIRRRAQQLGLSTSSLWRILRKVLGKKAYKISLVQELKPTDYGQRIDFANWAVEQLARNPDFHTKILFSDEAHFWLNGYVNKQNCRIWSSENPRVILQSPLHPEKVTV